MDNVYSNPTYLSKQITLLSLRNFILDRHIVETDTLLLSQPDYDSIAHEYYTTYHKQLPAPFLWITVLIRLDERARLQPGNVITIRNDTESLRVDPNDLFDPNRVVYRCGNCGSLVNSIGGELDRVEQRRNADYLNKFTTRAKVEYVSCDCCSPEPVPRPDPEPVHRYTPPQPDYESIIDKPLMSLTDADFESIQLHRTRDSEFETIYYCQERQSLTKIYFTPNEDSYSLRAHMLEEIERISTTPELIAAVRRWRQEAFFFSL